MSSRSFRRAQGLALAFIVCATVRVSAVTNYTVVGWNNLGMHCMDAEYSVFSILPPYNTIHAQVIDNQGLLVSNGLTLTYEAVADPSGSINTTSGGKTEFWQFLPQIFGLTLPVDVGLPVPGPSSFAMPGTNNVPQTMMFEAPMNWFAAYGIPLTPYDDALAKNAYPMMRIVAKQGAVTVGKLDIVLPVSDEMDCRACHASSAGPAAQPAAGWVNDSNPQRDYRLNILRLHDDREWTNHAALYAAALASNSFNAAGLYATVTVNTNPFICAACHKSEALPLPQLLGIPPLTTAVHGHHASVIDPSNGLTLDASANRSACYRCHPGSTTRCLRGAMGSAVAPDGTMAMQCQSCHGSMSDVGSAARTGWLEEPNCQACHNGGNRYTSVFDSPGHLRVPADSTFATTPNAPAAGLSLYRFSKGHGGLTCEACHGSTHAEFPSSHANDNIQSIQHQGHVGMFVECASCHGTQPATVSGGPHGLHPLGQTWVSQHPDVIESSGAAQCQACHGMDYRGTVLSRSQADRTVSAFGSKQFWRGFQIGCYTCHRGPGSETANANRPAVVSNASVVTATNTPVAIALVATDPDRDPLTLRIVSQASHGRVGLVGTAATYYPDTDYGGGDSFTFAAWDGQTDSNLGTVQITVGIGGGCHYTIMPPTAAASAFGGPGSVSVTAAAGCAWTAKSNAGWITINSGASGTGNGTVKYTVNANPSVAARLGTLTVAGQSFTITQAASTLDLTGRWVNLVQTCRGTGLTMRCKLRGHFVVQNNSLLRAPRSTLAIYQSTDNTLDNGDTLLRRYKVKQLKAGHSLKRHVVIKLAAGVSVTGKYMIALVDADDALPDIDDTNNIVAYGPLP